MTDEFFMRRAIDLAKLAAAEGETPVGAVVVRRGEIVGEGRNRRELGKNALYHAEIEAIHNACRVLSSWRLLECELFVTLEPCAMCAGAVREARINNLYFGAYDPKTGACGSIVDVLKADRLTHNVTVHPGILAEECSVILKEFFKGLRGK